MKSLRIRRGEIYLAQLFEFPHEDETAVGKERPVLVVQNDEDNDNQHYPFVIVAPFSTKKLDRVYKQDVALKAGEGGLGSDSKILLGILRTILKSDLIRRLGKLNKQRLEEVNIKLFRELGFLER
ncbi:type II toxin-antitoxin system PemK/MazF family toxin [candidate division KSB1 bacterium]|nr:type II toxin-antitoxin system PemK/MazF family toxin [candidate division KSB1 bacterium]